MKKLTTVLFGLMILAGFACSSTISEDETQKTTEKSKGAAASKVTPESPCELMNGEDLRNLFGVAGSFEIRMEDKKLTYPTCKFVWDDKVKSVMVIGGNEVPVEMESEVMLVLVKDATPSMFDRSTQVYKDGVVVENVGDQAMWGDKMAQLTFLHGGIMLHVHVKVDADNAVNKQKAIEIAQFVIAKT